MSCTGANPPRPGGFPGANSPGPMADLYGPSSQDSAVGNYISAASPQPGSGFNHSIAVSTALLHSSVMLMWPRDPKVQRKFSLCVFCPSYFSIIFNLQLRNQSLIGCSSIVTHFLWQGLDCQLSNLETQSWKKKNIRGINSIPHVQKYPNESRVSVRLTLHVLLMFCLGNKSITNSLEEAKAAVVGNEQIVKIRCPCN